MSREADQPKFVGGVLRLLLHGVVTVLGRLHWRASRFLAECVAGLWWICGLDGRKKNAIKNIRKAYPDLSVSQARRMLRASARTFCVAMADALQFRQQMVMGEWRDMVELCGNELLEERGEQQGGIFVTAHVGCWEVAGLALPQLGYPLTSVARGLPYPRLDEYVKGVRETGGQTIVNKEGALRELIGALRKGRHVALLIDQDGRRDGVFVDFMGRPSSVHTSIARLSISTGCPVAFLYTRAEGEPPKFNIEITDVVWPRKEADKDEEVFRITQRLMNDAEDVIRKYPDEWLWTQKQWKTYPGKFTEGKRPMEGVLRDDRAGE